MWNLFCFSAVFPSAKTIPCIMQRNSLQERLFLLSFLSHHSNSEYNITNRMIVCKKNRNTPYLFPPFLSEFIESVPAFPVAWYLFYLCKTAKNRFLHLTKGQILSKFSKTHLSFISLPYSAIGRRSSLHQMTAVHYANSIA